MIYDVLADFNAKDIKYDKDTTDPRVPIDSLSKFYDNKVKIETTKIKDIEKALSQYNTLTDDVLGIEVHNGDQYNRLKDERIKYGITDDIFPSDIKDLSNTAKLSQANSKIKRYLESPNVKMIFEEQKKGNEYMSKADEIMSMNEPLGILAKKDFLEKYGNKTEKSYSGFELNINDYVPLDVDAEIAKLSESIEREFRLEKDPNSPTGDGYLFINKISGVTENGKEVFNRRINALKSNKRFDNNMKSYIAMNSAETDYNDPEAYDNFLTEMIETHLGDKVVSTDVKKIDTKIVLGEDGTPQSQSQSGGGTSVFDGLKTEHERDAYRLRKYLEEQPDLKDYDFSGIQTFSVPKDKTFVGVRDEMASKPGETEEKPTGRKVLVFKGKDDEETEIPISKIKDGGSRVTLAMMESPQTASSKPLTQQEIEAQKQDVSLNNPERAQAVSGLKKGEGRYLPDGTWVQNTMSGKIPMVKDAVRIADRGLKVKSTPGQPADSYHLTRSTANKAEVFAGNIGDYMINEAGNDSLRTGHNNKKHYDGTAFDLSLKGSDSKDINRLFETMLKARESGLDAQYESKESSVVDALNKRINVWNVANPDKKLKKALSGNWAPHFSIYDNEYVNIVKIGEIPALDVASDKNNSDYYNFVESNNLKNRSAKDVVEFNARYLKDKYNPIYRKLAGGDKEVPILGEVQTVMSIIAQSPTMAQYMNINADEVYDIMNFVRSPQIQDEYMNIVLNKDYYPAMEKVPPSNKFSRAEQLILLHTMGKTGGMEAITGKRPVLTGYEILNKYGFIENGEPNVDSKKYDSLVKSLNSQKGKSDIQRNIDQGQVSLLKLAMKELRGEMPEEMSDIDYIVSNESEGIGYGAANPQSTAIGKYQFVWNTHGKDIMKLMEGREIPVENIDVSLPSKPATDSLGLNRFKVN